MSISLANLAGAGLGGFLAGEVGAAVGIISTPVVRAGLARLLYEFQRRQHSPREEQRITTVITVAAQHIQARLNAGEQPRDDGFFEPIDDDRSAAEEVAEAMVRRARDEPQHKKLRYYGQLLANLAFDATIDQHMAHLLIRKADGLTYRQLCLLALCVQPEVFELRLSSEVVAEQSLLEQSVVEELTLLREAGFVRQDGMLFGRQLWQTGEPSPLAQTMYRLMGLETLNPEDIANTRQQLAALRPNP